MMLCVGQNVRQFSLKLRMMLPTHWAVCRSLCIYLCLGHHLGHRYWLVQPATSLEIVDLALGTKMFGLRCIRQSTNVLLCELSSGAEKL